MKTTKLLKSLLLAAVVACSMPMQAQMVSNNNEDEVNKADTRGMMPYRDKQVIVKFKNDCAVNVKRSSKGRFQSAGVPSVDKVLNNLAISEAVDLMPLTGAIKNRAPRRAKAPSGRMVVEPDLSKLYCFKYEQEGITVEEAVEALKALPEVEFAEPNYLAFIQATGTEDLLSYISEPLYNQQWGLNAIKMPQLWAMDKVETERPVIAILDTGVDINHPDLAANIWTNAAEAAGADYEDDDNNGYRDDVHGWDFVAGTPIINNGMDRNGHGTHCAGIAAAVGNNNQGIVGANPDAYILPIKVMGDDGTGDIATICRGIDYAVACKAHVLSMSFGGGCSAAEYQALCKSLTNYAVLCGAAGNNGVDIYTHVPREGLIFPGAYDIVLGVMASNADGSRAGYSNYDPDGPFFSRYNMDKPFSTDVTWNDEMMWNYDVMAPGTGIMSTFLNGTYKSLNGTSMATPMVAGAISRILQVKGYDYARDYGLMGDMAMAKDGSYLDLAVFDAQMAASFDETNRDVALALIALEIDDSEGDGDGRFDAGETINIWPTIRSLWGHAENIKIGIEPYDENTPTDAIEVLENNVDFGWSLNSRGSFKSLNPIRVKVNENAWDGMHLPYKIVIISDNLLAGIEQEHTIEIENAVELGGMINHDMTLYPNVHYVVTGNLAIPDNVTFTIMPGTNLYFRDNVSVSVADNGHFIAVGNSENLIVISGSGKYYGDNYQRTYFNLPKNTTLEYVVFRDMNMEIGTNSSRKTFLNNCIIQNCLTRAYELMCYSDAFETNIISNTGNASTYPAHSYNCNMISNKCSISGIPYNSVDSCNIINNIHSGRHTSLAPPYGGSVSIYFNEYPSYLGSSDESTVIKGLYDIRNGFGFSEINISNMLTRPNPKAHGIVWKVVVDGYDAQDEFDLLPPLGVGRHKFEVYYNRDDIDTTFTPSVSMGLREPYTQTPIAEGGYWCVKDSASVYTVFLNITGKTNCDGLNRIYVTGGKDYDHFDIPDEKYRFNVLVQAAGSMATGFEAVAGLGNVKLTWHNENNNFDDAMGFNVYRFQLSEAGDTLNRVRLNETIVDIEATEYTDFDVIPGQTYYYYYKVLSTDLKEYDISNVVAATPITAQRGDANGSMNVDVADVITEVAYMTGNDPQPFIFDAADVNADQNVNILDVVGTVNIIIDRNMPDAMAQSTATYRIEDGILYVESPVELAGVQVILNMDADATLTPLEALTGMEQMSQQLGDNARLFLAFSMNGKTIPAGKNALLRLSDGTVNEIVLSDKWGHNLLVEEDTPTLIDRIAADQQVHRGVYDLMGRKVANDAMALPRLQPGIYIVNGKKVIVK